MSNEDTPRTNEAVWQCEEIGIPTSAFIRDFARKLERENNLLREIIEGKTEKSEICSHNPLTTDQLAYMVKSSNWEWFRNSDCKYVTVTIDMRGQLPTTGGGLDYSMLRAQSS